jgi:flagellar hook-associated protein 3 FlgL
MRISTNTIYEMGSARLGDLQSNLVKTQQQLSTQRRVLTPADDPVASATALAVTQTMSMNEQYGINRQNAKNALSEQESVLQSITNLFQDVKSLIVTAGNGAIDDRQRGYLAAELEGRFDELLGHANSRDGGGNYMFGGFQVTAPPFSRIPSGAQYNGDQGQRMLQVGPSRQIPLNDSGAAIFEMMKTGNGTFETKADVNNSGSGVVGSGAVVDGSQINGNEYVVHFSPDPNAAPGTQPAMTYTVFNNTTGAYMDASGNFTIAGTMPPAAGPDPVGLKRTNHVSGEAIVFGGMQIDVKGDVKPGDKFTTQPSENQPIFETLTNLLKTLRTPAAGAKGQADLTNGLSIANNNIDNALDKILDVRAAVGTRLKELEVLENTGSDLNIQYTDALNKLQEIDMPATISSFTQQQITLEAAQKSFIAISRLSLFDML